MRAFARVSARRARRALSASLTIAALSAGALAAAPALAQTASPAPSAAPVAELGVLSSEDARLYAGAFAAIRRREFEAAEAAAAAVRDPLLKGRLAFARLMHPDRRADYAELAAWLEAYGDQPEAERIYALALKRQPSGAPPPAGPKASTARESPATWARVEAAARRLEAAQPKGAAEAKSQAAREAYYAGEVDKAHALATESGELWIGGLSAFRLKRYDEALARFSALAEDAGQDEWVRSGAAYWAARAAIAEGAPEAAPRFLAMAASTPYTFYGLIAERQLGLDPGVSATGVDLTPPIDPTRLRVSAVAGQDGAAVARLVRSDPRAARAAAFAQIGMKAEAGIELRAALADADDEAARRDWTRLGLALNLPLTSSADLPQARGLRFDLAQYPTPELAPMGGFTLDRALVYALVRQESRFDPEAKSASGAYGLMQLMPATAARMAGDDKLKADPARLKDPAVNLRLGQDYVGRLLEAVNGDLLHAVAAYNSGPGTILKTLAKMGEEADSLLAIESMPGAQTREFVEKVVAGYWIYRNIFGQDSRTLDAAASGAKAIRAALDPPSAPAIQAAGEVLASFFVLGR